jgi:phosphohistidine phosphatase
MGANGVFGCKASVAAIGRLSNVSSRKKMLKTLLILRHAKAEPAADFAEDHLRKLAERGHAQATAMGDFLREYNLKPQHILCSTATRTRETLAALGLDIPVAFTEKLYLASAGELLAMLNALPEEAETVLLVGHNPGMHELVALLSYDGAREEDMERLREGFPTCALAVLQWHGAWSALKPDACQLRRFVTPDAFKGL